MLPGGTQGPAIDFDSDQETKTSISEEISLEIDRRSSADSHKHNKKLNKIYDSDTDLENEILLEGEVDHSRLRRGLANLKSKVKAKHEAHQAKKATLSTTVSCTPSAIRNSMKKDISPSRSTGSSSSSTSLRGTFLRRRRNKYVDQGELLSPTNISSVSALAATVISGEMAATVPVVVSGKPAKKSKHREVTEKKDIEIESGVEMLEDMIPPVSGGASPGSDIFPHRNSDASASFNAKRDNLDLPIPQVPLSTSSPSDTMKNPQESSSKNIQNYSYLQSAMFQNGEADFRRTMLEIYLRAKNLPILSFVGLIVTMLLPINDFIRGVLSCLLGVTIVESVWTFTQGMIDYLICKIKPERKKFRIPDYTKMPICEVPAAEEFKTVKSYGGWMNEADSYDPNNFHISMTRSAYIKLDGTILYISNTNARIPKRLMWNEPPIDRKSIVFTTHRSFDLLGCRIELLPIGLAKKRYFNRKYPIQLIVKTFKKTEETPDQGKTAVKNRKTFHHFKSRKHEKNEAKEINDNKTPQSADSSKTEAEIDFGATIMNADLQKLQDDVNPDEDLSNITVPCGDEVRILLFARGAREKEDWYRRFLAASIGDVHDKDLHLKYVKLIDDKGLQAAATKAAQLLTNPKPRENSQSSVKPTAPVLEHQSTMEEFLDVHSQKDETDPDFEFVEVMPEDPDNIEGLLMTAGVARNDPAYVKFMALYQKACSQSHIPVYKGNLLYTHNDKSHTKRTIRHENELWKGIDQSLFLGPSGSVVWANVIIGRLLFSTLQNPQMLEKFQDILQKKLNSIKLPSFMEEVIIKNIDLGDKPPLIHRVSQPLLDERGIWLDMDVTYEGLCHITVTTKLNLLRLKRPARTYADSSLNFPTSTAQTNQQYSTLLQNENAAGNNIGVTFGPGGSVGSSGSGPSTSAAVGGCIISAEDELIALEDALCGSAIYDSDAESTGSSSSESENSLSANMGENPNSVTEGASNPGNARRIFKFVDRITTSNFFQYATELSYVQKAMENMSTTITLGIDVHGLVSRLTLNMPPPPSDRLWLAFRAPPRLWLTARPTVGDKSVDWSIVTNVIESKLCEAVNKYLVYPNMVDLTIPILGKPAAPEQ